MMEQDNKDKIAEIISSHYNDFKGEKMKNIKELHKRMRSAMTDEQYLQYLEKIVKINPRPVFTPNQEIIKQLL